MDIVCPLWKRAWPGQRGLRTWVSLKSAMKGPRSWPVAVMPRKILPNIVMEVFGKFYERKVMNLFMMQLIRQEGFRAILSQIVSSFLRFYE